jgi:hypothetical protein
VLGIASGYRPVSGWFGKLEHINLQRGDYWISDKESGFGDNSRVVILPNEAILVLQGYITYCSQMAIHNGNTQCDLSVRYQRVLDSSEHLFFYIDENSITECTPSAYARHIDPVFPVQPNWARHHIRTLLLKKEMNPALVSAWMGHQYLGKRALHQHSSLTRTHLELVTDTISQHLKELNVEMTQW